VTAGGPAFGLKFRVRDPGDPAQGGWVVAGLGMRIRDGRLTLLEEDEWDERFRTAEPRVEDLDGHFCGLRWDADGMSAFSDAVGLRTVYLTRQGGGVLFSTRLDWLVQSTSVHIHDFEALGGQWLGRAELAPRTAFVGVERLGQGGRANISAEGFTIRNQPFELGAGPATDPRDVVMAVAGPHLPNHMPTIACSGGLDSRLLVAAASHGQTEFGLHTYGPDDHPDVIVARRLGAELGVEVTELDASPASISFEDVQALATAVNAYAPASTVSDWVHYSQIRSGRLVALDGSFGEIGRCFFYRDLRSGVGADALRSRDVSRLADLQRHQRPNVFSPAVRSVMDRGHRLALESAVSGLPDNLDPDTMADLLMMRLEAPRHAGFSSSHIDSLAAGFFPFTQPSLVRSLLSGPSRERRNGALYRRLVKEWSPALARLPLVRNGQLVTICPFDLSGIPAGIWSRAQRWTGRAWRDERPAQFLDMHELRIRDLVRSRHCKDFEAYDNGAIRRLVDGYFDGRRDLASAVDRWLSFELWRLGCQGVSV